MPAQGWLARLGRGNHRRDEDVSEHTDTRFDALIAGGGVIGLACAWRASQRGLRVCVLERDRAGAGATDVAAGMLAPVGEASWGEEDLLALNLASLELWPEFAAELEREAGASPGYARVGALHVALDRDELEELRRRHDLHLEHDLSSELLGASDCRELDPGLAPGVAGGVLAPHEGVADPRSLSAALMAALRGRGVEVREGEEVVEAEFGDPVTVRTASGAELKGRTLLLAAGCHSGSAEWLPPEARPPVRPVKGEIVTLRSLPEQPKRERIVVGDRLYMVPRPDGRLLVGATVSERGFDTTVTAGGVHELLREAYRTIPDVAEMELVDARAGLRPGTPDNAPLIGPGRAEGLLIASGNFRNGVLQAPATAEAVSAMLAGEEPATDVAAFDPARFDRAAGGVEARGAAS
jgi:glycine oxidase